MAGKAGPGARRGGSYHLKIHDRVLQLNSFSAGLSMHIVGYTGGLVNTLEAVGFAQSYLGLTECFVSIDSCRNTAI